jgi:hypothetical protein
MPVSEKLPPTRRLRYVHLHMEVICWAQELVHLRMYGLLFCTCPEMQYLPTWGSICTAGKGAQDGSYLHHISYAFLYGITIFATCILVSGSACAMLPLILSKSEGCTSELHAPTALRSARHFPRSGHCPSILYSTISKFTGHLSCERLFTVSRLENYIVQELINLCALGFFRIYLTIFGALIIL